MQKQVIFYNFYFEIGKGTCLACKSPRLNPYNCKQTVSTSPVHFLLTSLGRDTVTSLVHLYPAKSLFVKVIEDRLSIQLNYCKDIVSFVA